VSDGGVPYDPMDPDGLDERVATLACLATLVALRASPASYRVGVDRALAAGASVDDVIALLKVVAPSVGLARVVAAAPGLALALGYDIDRALETLDIPQVSRVAGPARATADDRADRVNERGAS
jgi:4-carboxymuconolactone decarboxylase